MTPPELNKLQSKVDPDKSTPHNSQEVPTIVIGEGQDMTSFTDILLSHGITPNGQAHVIDKWGTDYGIHTLQSKEPAGTFHEISHD